MEVNPEITEGVAIPIWQCQQMKGDLQHEASSSSQASSDCQEAGKGLSGELRFCFLAHTHTKSN